MSRKELAVEIVDGNHNGKTVTGLFTALTAPRKGRNGFFITIPAVELDAQGRNTVRVAVDPDNVTVPSGDDIYEFFNQTTVVEKTVDKSTPEEALARMKHTFDVLDKMTLAAATGTVKGIVLFGPPGVGKTFNVTAVLGAYNQLINAGCDPLFNVISGFMTTTHLYIMLYENRHANNVLVLDDIDSVFCDGESLNLLKKALDTTGDRTISYLAESKALRDRGIPNSFDFEGSVILITNIDFYKTRGKIKAHLDAIISRCHYLDLTISSKRDKMLWLKEIAIEQGMLKKKGLSEEEANEIVGYIDENQDRMRELSLRMILKISDLKVASKDDWREIAEITCMTN